MCVCVCMYACICACVPTALDAGVGGFILTGVKIGGLHFVFLYFCGCYGAGWVCACIHAYTYTNYLSA